MLKKAVKCFISENIRIVLNYLFKLHITFIFINIFINRLFIHHIIFIMTSFNSWYRISIIIAWINFILLLKFKLSNDILMSSEFSNSSNEILILSWKNSTYHTLLIAFDFYDHKLFFIINYKVCNDRKTFSNIIISIDELNFILWIFLYS